MSLSRRLMASGVALAAAGTAIVASTAVGDAASASSPSADQARPIVIAHRGASEYRHEESAHAYELTIDMGA